jgi:hypothetical protein
VLTAAAASTANSSGAGGVKSAGGMHEHAPAYGSSGGIYSMAAPTTAATGAFCGYHMLESYMIA